MSMTQRQMEYMGNLLDKEAELARIVGEGHARDLAHVAMAYSNDAGVTTGEVLDKMVSMAMSGKHRGQIMKEFKRRKEPCQKPASIPTPAPCDSKRVMPERRWKPRVHVDGRL